MEKRGKKGGERIRETERDFFEGGVEERES